MNIKQIISVFVLLLLSLSAATAQQVGEITYMEGDVEITRNGDIIEFDDVDIGTTIENYDVITTSPRSTVSINLSYNKAINSEIIVAENTVFAVEIDNIDAVSQANFNMFSGGLALKVQKMTSGNSLSVNTEAASMGVRGTRFFVEASPGGDLLVSCDEGSVECAAKGGKKLFAKPGSVVEQPAGEELRNVAVAVSSLKSFRQNWMAEKLEVFKADPLRAIRQYAQRYDELYTKFNKAYDALAAHKEIINRWNNEDKKGQIGGTMELLRDKKALIGKLFALRAQLVIFEKIYYRLVELHGYYKQGYGKGNIKAGLSVKTFFTRFEREQKELKQKMAVIKHVIKMYARRNGGTFPADGISGEADDMFADEDSFFGDDDF
jgi:hypothetical protein